MDKWVNEQNEYRFLFSETMGIPVLKTEERNISDIENRLEDIEFIMTGRLIDKMKDDEDLIEKLQAELTQLKAEKSGEWVSVEERLPDDGVYVLVAVKIEGRKTVVYMSAVVDGLWSVKSQFMHKQVTHWQPLPQPPKEGD